MQLVVARGASVQPPCLLALRPDPVEARCEEVIPRLTGDLKTLASRALTLYQQCGKSLQELPREPAREEMARTLSRMTREAVRGFIGRHFTPANMVLSLAGGISRSALRGA